MRPSAPSSAPFGREVPDDPVELLERFQRLMEGEGKSPWTVKQYVFWARHFLVFLKKPLRETNPSDLEAWREHLVLTKHCSKTSVYGALRAITFLLRAFGSRAADGVEVPRRPARLPGFLTEEEAHRLLTSSEGEPRDFALLHVLGYGGLRVGEVCRLSVEDLDLEGGLLRVRSGKGDKDRMVVIDGTTCEAVRQWLAVRGEQGDPRVFPICRESVERMVRARARDAGIGKKVTPHTLRHTLATTLLKRGLDLRFIQKQLGHASVATTQIYTHVDTGALQDAYRRAQPTY
ncbi:MAG: tyrosine-type recombinase/integrase [Euryarchaeota archaeon]|nr:tyrosine-type recombinase/integrase [Euryarchaeota archaeon]MDE1837767.1 tyrosine-type recombinase/integrase [Euryarchaeota archaeon]MDE1880194.1 tyrosine-type recombinase/integrase [Euryarchaeota archaeon]MDE2045411.1 tyrosine-type recombinase/integrase [Thermoplasmata archaeon]